MSCVDDLEQLAYKMSSFAGLPSAQGCSFTEKLIRCYAVVVDSHICVRVNTLPAYVEANRMVSSSGNIVQAYSLSLTP